MKKSLLVFLVSFLCSTSIFAADATNMKIGIVDVQKIIQKAPETQKYSDALKAKFKPRQDKIVELNKKVQDDEAKLTKNGSVMKASERDKIQDKLTSEKRDLQRMMQDYQDDLTQARDRDMQELFAHIEKAVNTVAKREKFDLVLQKTAAPYAEAHLDITEAVIKELS